MNKKLNLNKNKKALTMTFIILLIISLITLILTLSYIVEKVQDSNYQTSLTSCNLLFSNINGQRGFFDEELINPNDNLIDIISSSCPSKSVKTENDDLKKAANLIEDCFYKTAKGQDILAENSVGTSICLYCGEIKFDSKQENFGEKLYTELKDNKELFSNDLESTNLNDFFLREMFSKETIAENEIIRVVYYQGTISTEDKHKVNDLNSDFGDKINYVIDYSKLLVSRYAQKFSNYLASSDNTIINVAGSTGGLVSKYLASKEEAFSGIMLSKVEEEKSIDNIDFTSDETLKSKQNKFGKVVANCNYLIIPNKNFN